MKNKGNEKVTFGTTKFKAKPANLIDYGVFKGRLHELMKDSPFTGSTFMDGVDLGKSYLKSLEGSAKSFEALIISFAELGDSKIEGNEGFNTFTRELAKIVAPLVTPVTEEQQGERASDKEIQEMVEATMNTMNTSLVHIAERHTCLLLDGVRDEEVKLSEITMKALATSIRTLDALPWPANVKECQEIFHELKQAAASIHHYDDTLLVIVDNFDRALTIATRMAENRGDLK